jgi:hypothetical protein
MVFVCSLGTLFVLTLGTLFALLGGITLPYSMYKPFFRVQSPDQSKIPKRLCANCHPNPSPCHPQTRYTPNPTVNPYRWTSAK